MNDLAIRIFWLMGQVTLLSLAAAGLSALLSRYRPGAGAGVALAGLGGLVILTLLAASPMPVWWSWSQLLHGEEISPPTGPDLAISASHTLPGQNAEETPSPTGSPSMSSLPAAEGWTLGGLRRLWSQLRPIGRAARRSPIWGPYVSVVLLAGTCFFVIRMLIGLHAVRRWQTNSRPVDDPALLALLTQMHHQMGCRRAIDLRETTDVGGPVTVGWRRPIVLLPLPWRTWSEEELRAALAHEVAHVRRADYAAWLLARFSVALHFYHPLAHWLAARLHLQQELAADALGARHAGGRRVYMRALARLALRQEETRCAEPARAFLAIRETLLRRIAMLRTEETSRGGTWCRPLAVLVLGLVIVGVSALRDPAQAREKPSAKNPETKPAPTPGLESGEKSTAVQRPPFEYLFCAPEAAGFFAFRPSIYFRLDPRRKEEANKAIAAVLKEFGGPESFPKVEEIEQISGCIFLKYNEKAPKGQRGQLMGSLLILRTANAHDWKQTLEGLVTKILPIPYEGQTYYKIAVSDFKNPAMAEMSAAMLTGDAKTFYFFQPDAHTLAMGSEEQFKEMIRNGPRAKPAWAVAAGWEHVEHSVFAAALTNQDQRFAKEWLKAPPDEVPGEARTAMAKTTDLVLGIDYDGELRSDLFTACATQEDAVAVANIALQCIRKGQALLDATQGTSHDAEPELLWCKRFLEQTSVGLQRGAGDRKAALVHIQGHVKANVPELIELLTKAKVEAVEEKDN
ncbi:MAG TPA: M56 family metallopeptidase [Gemmataceae bacterium]|nr:M56 family metallopeptidase [Gemmataceae bacterium]